MPSFQASNPPCIPLGGPRLFQGLEASQGALFLPQCLAAVRRLNRIPLTALNSVLVASFLTMTFIADLLMGGSTRLYNGVSSYFFFVFVCLFFFLDLLID